jgi:3-hydroxyisobutyrate dehydrogenase
MTKLKVGFIGLGAMGAAMATHLQHLGLLIAVGNRTFAKAQKLADELLVAAPANNAALAALCEVVVLCVTADADVLAICTDLAPALKPGSIVIDHSTVSSATAKQAQTILAKYQCDFLDAPVSGGVEGAQNGKLSIMVGGDATTLARVQVVLAAYGARIAHMGGIGAGQNTKAVNQVLIAGIAQAVCEGLALGEKLGLDSATLLPTLLAGAASSWFLEKRGATMLRSEFSVGFKLALLHKDLKIVRELAVTAGTDRSMIEKSIVDYAELMAQGHGDDDISSLIRLKRGAPAV